MIYPDEICEWDIPNAPTIQEPWLRNHLADNSFFMIRKWQISVSIWQCSVNYPEIAEIKMSLVSDQWSIYIYVFFWDSSIHSGSSEDMIEDWRVQGIQKSGFIHSTLDWTRLEIRSHFRYIYAIYDLFRK